MPSSRHPSDNPHPDVAAQLAALVLDGARPLIICDADEVLFEFMAGFETFLEDNGMFFDWRSFALAGNIHYRSTGGAAPRALPADEVPGLIERFFAECTETLRPVPGAASALTALGQRRAQVVVLSNLPLDQRSARRRALVRHDMDYPLVANVGGKGPAVRDLAARVRAPVFFLDDIPHNHAAVSRAAADVVRLHFIADPRLARLLGPAAHCHHRADNWPEARAIIERHLDERGY